MSDASIESFLAFFEFIDPMVVKGFVDAVNSQDLGRGFRPTCVFPFAFRGIAPVNERISKRGYNGDVALVDGEYRAHWSNRPARGSLLIPLGYTLNPGPDPVPGWDVHHVIQRRTPEVFTDLTSLLHVTEQVHELLHHGGSVPAMLNEFTEWVRTRLCSTFGTVHCCPPPQLGNITWDAVMDACVKRMAPEERRTRVDRLIELRRDIPFGPGHVARQGANEIGWKGWTNNWRDIIFPK